MVLVHGKIRIEIVIFLFFLQFLKKSLLLIMFLKNWYRLSLGPNWYWALLLELCVVLFFLLIKSFNFLKRLLDFLLMPVLLVFLLVILLFESENLFSELQQKLVSGCVEFKRTLFSLYVSSLFIICINMLGSGILHAQLLGRLSYRQAPVLHEV